MATTLSDISELIIDTKHNTPEYSEHGYPCIRTPNIGRGYFILENVKYVNEKTYQNWTERAVPKTGDLILAREAPVGNVSYIPPGLKPCIGQRTVLIRPKKDYVDSRYLTYLLLGDESQNRMHSMSGGATVAHLNMSDIRKMELPDLPPLSAQRKITAILSAYDDLIENNLRRIKILEKMAQNLYREWFIHFRYPIHFRDTGSEPSPLPSPSGRGSALSTQPECHPSPTGRRDRDEGRAKLFDSPLGKIPEGWEVVPLSSIVDFAKGRKPDENRSEPIAGDVPLLLIDALRGGEPQFTAPTRLVIAEARDTIMVMDGGSSCEVAMGFSGAVGSTLGRFRTTKPYRFSPHALYRFLEDKTNEFKSKNIGAAIPHSNKDYILIQMIPLPPQNIALVFHDYLEPIQSTIEILKAKNTALRRTRDLLLPRLISGEVDVSELDITVPEATL